MFKGKCLRGILFLCAALATAATSAPVSANENSCGPASPAEEQVIKLQTDNELLHQRLMACEATKNISLEQLHRKKAQRLKEIAANVKQQRQTTSDFEGFVKWMSANLAGYNRYIQAGSYAAAMAKMLPIPYAGQTSVFTKFVAQFTLSLNAASVSITNYLNSSQKFLAMSETIDPANRAGDAVAAEAAAFADQKLLKDMGDTQQKLAALSDLSAGALSFLETVNHYACNTDEYWNKVKGVFKKEMDPKEKSFISESTGTLKAQANRFNERLRNFELLGNKETASIKSLAVYDELIAEATTPQQ